MLSPVASLLGYTFIFIFLLIYLYPITIPSDLNKFMAICIHFVNQSTVTVYTRDTLWSNQHQTAWTEIHKFHIYELLLRPTKINYLFSRTSYHLLYDFFQKNENIFITFDHCFSSRSARKLFVGFKNLIVSNVFIKISCVLREIVEKRWWLILFMVYLCMEFLFKRLTFDKSVPAK